MNKNLKDAYTVKEVTEIMALSRTAGYEFINNKPPFPVKHIGKSIRIPMQPFQLWWNDENFSEQTGQTQKQ